MATREITTALPKNAVWFITGCSKGFGHELAKQARASGYRTVVTARHFDDASDMAGGGESLALELDVTDQDQVDAAVKAAEDRFGGIDVLVNNAGIGNFAPIDENEEDQLRRMFDINVFGMSRMIHAALPGMRNRRSGIIVNFSSSGGLRSYPSVGYFNATKFAVEGLSETLSQELEELGVRVMFVEPSGFLTGSALPSPQAGMWQLEDEAVIVDPSLQRMIANAGQQPEDPVSSARAMVKAIESPNPPWHLLLGNDAYYCKAGRPARRGNNLASRFSWA
jgi:NADP-dependent 3-hydroxy acid dehydrogenase YdfG